ncbi:ADP-ribosylglycohydrolase family protein [Micromonospora sp. NBC_01655]|uniref:ADP-ribosylglycohydrolase family protein n=1 Tax=Micromonospora sp. NBC_01655 TaxID=2975983 RepID=UPI002254893B|nr:ADP-ribosylglycohydrolase family protein [Micromonospora sp. NBC_01655]MCX4471440.1 ADP-ribosylglycohydrolase family protein [Micromonospora sp. NBC_01655]
MSAAGTPTRGLRLTWVQPEDLLPHELAASRDEGRDVTALADRWAAAGGDVTAPVSGASPVPAPPELRALAVDLLDAADALPGPDGADEPDDLDAVRKTWPGAWDLPTTVERDRLHGAWLGRAAGCLLGKPVEKIPRHGIREILSATGRWPLRDWFTARGLPADVAARWPWNRRSAPTSLAENIAGMPEDDDLNFALLALRVLETHGSGFTSADVAQAWLDWLPAGRVFTAERVAYRNLLLGLTPPDTARRQNPFREWIGAQIRADVYGWTNPGRPDRAAEAAWRDAAVSHVRAGAYGAIWVAALAAAAPVAGDVDAVLDAGESVLPPGSRFTAAIREARALGAGDDWESIVDTLHARHGHLHWVHVRNNAALVAAALAYGRGDLEQSICAVVAGGWDTDSNGATVGAVTGALAGAARLPGRWVAPLRNRLASSIAGFDGIGFDELADRTLTLVHGNLA